MANSLQYDSVDTAVEKLSKIQEYLDLGYSTALEIALDIEESNEAEEPSPEVEHLKQITMEYVAMEEELKQWLNAAKLTKTAFRKEYQNVTEYVLVKRESEQQITNGKMSNVYQQLNDLNTIYLQSNTNILCVTYHTISPQFPLCVSPYRPD